MVEVLSPAQELRERGYYVSRGLTASLVHTYRILATWYPKHAEKAVRVTEAPHAVQIEMPWDWRVPWLLTWEWPKMLKLLGLADFRIRRYYCTVQPSGALGRPWHQEWPEWSESPDQPPEVVIMINLDDVTAQSGCLRVVPRSHGRHLPPVEGRRVKVGPNGGVDVPVQAGDIVVADGRLLTATRANSSAADLLCAVVHCVPGFGRLSADTQAKIAADFAGPPARWWLENSYMGHKLRPLVPAYNGPETLPRRPRPYVPYM